MLWKIFICVSFYGACAFSQHLFPLNHGNVWQYHSSDPLDNQLLTMADEYDTIADNGRTYHYISGSLFLTSLLRTEGSKVFAYSSYNKIEYTLFDLEANSNDTISILNNGNDFILLRGCYFDTVSKTNSWNFIYYMGNLGFLYWFIKDSIGLTAIIGEPGRYYHLVGAIIGGDTTGTVTEVENQMSSRPLNIYLSQNYPNPFNPTTTITFTIPIGTSRQVGTVSLRVYDLLGREVATLINEKLPPGTHTRQWNASRFPSGVYFYRLSANGYSETKKLVLMK